MTDDNAAVEVQQISGSHPAGLGCLDAGGSFLRNPMPLTTDPEAALIHEGAGNYSFTMLESNAPVACRVTAFYLLGRAAEMGVHNLSLEALFKMYRSDVEKIASAQFDSGISPWVTAANLAWYLY